MTGYRFVFTAVGKVTLERFDVPNPGSGDVLLENDYTVLNEGTERAN